MKQVKFIRELATFPKSGPWHIDANLVGNGDVRTGSLPDPRNYYDLRCAKSDGFGVIVWMDSSPVGRAEAHFVVFYGDGACEKLEFQKFLVKQENGFYPRYSETTEWHEAVWHAHGYVKFDGQAEEVVGETYISADSLGTYEESRALVFFLAGELFAADGHRIEPRDFHAPGIEFVDVTGHND